MNGYRIESEDIWGFRHIWMIRATDRAAALRVAELPDAWTIKLEVTELPDPGPMPEDMWS